MTKELPVRDAKDIDRDLALIKNHRDSAVKRDIALDKIQYTHPLMTVSAPSVIMSFIVQAGYALPTNYFIAIVAISAIAAVMQHLGYSSLKKDENNRIELLNDAEEEVLKGGILEAPFAKIIDEEVKTRSSIWSKVSPSSVFKYATAVVAGTAMIGMGVNYDSDKDQDASKEVALPPAASRPSKH